MLDWLESFGNFLSGIIDFIVSFFTNVIEVVKLVFKGFTFLMEIITFMPPMYQFFFVGTLCFAVIVTILHFGG